MTRQETIHNALSLLPDELLAETEARRGGTKRRHWVKWVAAAACCLLAAGILYVTHAPSNDLPKLTVADVKKSGMGMEAYQLNDISELITANPWSEDMALETLPVYRNAMKWDGGFPAAQDDRAAMEARLEELMNFLGIRATPTEQPERGGPGGICAKADGITVTVDPTLTAEIHFDPPVVLGDGYGTDTRARAEELAAYLKQAYSGLLAMEEPQTAISGGSYDSSGKQHYQIAFYNAKGDDVQRLLQYHFSRVEFYCEGDGNRLFLIRLFQTDLSEKVGEYPIISADEAREYLAQGAYVTSVDRRLIGEETVARVELVYRTGVTEDYFMPYYRFFVELPREERDGRKTYGAYYVPAIEHCYLSEMTLWDGKFN